MKGDVEEVQSGLKKDQVSHSTCSWPAVEKTIGLKLCADYHFINVTKNETAAYSILSGPAGFRVYLQKADPNAKTYLLEYKWTDLHNSSVVSLTFDTSGSSIRRILGANLTLERDSQNLTLLLQSTAGTILARGKYKNSEMDKHLQLTLDINNKQHLDASCSLQVQEIKNGFTYYPKFYLGVNGERVAELQGEYGPGHGTALLLHLKVISHARAEFSPRTLLDLFYPTKQLLKMTVGKISRCCLLNEEIIIGNINREIKREIIKNRAFC